MTSTHLFDLLLILELHVAHLTLHSLHLLLLLSVSLFILLSFGKLTLRRATAFFDLFSIAQISLSA